MPDIKSIKCASCGGDVKLDFDNLISYCPYCGAALSIDLSIVKDVLIEKEKTVQNKDYLEAANKARIIEIFQKNASFIILLSFSLLAIIIMGIFGALGIIDM